MIEKYNEVSYHSLPAGVSSAAEEKPENKKDLKE